MKLKAIAFLVGGLALGILLGLFIFSGGLNRSRQSSESSARDLPPTVGAAAPAFVLRRLDGKTQSLGGLKGTPVVINFWATWCPPCKEEMPLLSRYAKKYVGKLVILGVDSGEEAQVVQPFVGQVGVTYPILLDTTGAVSKRYFVKDYPTTFFVDPDGTVRAQHLGLLTEDLLVRYLNTISIEP